MPARDPVSWPARPRALGDAAAPCHGRRRPAIHDVQIPPALKTRVTSPRRP